ncbi:hypothetical protein [Arthrobacter sp. 24S4-2]|uniref:hypothetical protein n=1 Tax=Arthrobacter sp. 24S4-2 TaxID=2575374 RepID=UPI0034A0BEEA
MLTSEAYAQEDAAIAGIWAVQEVAATGSIVDLTGSNAPEAVSMPHWPLHATGGRS